MRADLFTRIGWYTMALAGVIRGAQAQSPTAYAHEFTRVSSVRALDDGRLLVADRGDKRLVLLSALNDDGSAIGRNGNGPLEYQVPGRLIAMGGDTSLMIDAQTRRWHLLVGGKLVGDPALPSTLVQAVSGFPLIGRDADARLYWLAGLPPSDRTRRVLARGAIEEADSMLLLRRAPRGGTTDTLARLKGPFGGRNMVPRVVMGVKSVYMLHALLRTPDQAALCEDGWAAVLRSDTPRVDWIDRDGRLRTGARLPVVLRPVTARDRQQAVVEFLGERVAPFFKAEEFPGWPAVMPAYAATGITCTRQGEVLLQRSVAVGVRAVVDRVDRNGRVTRSYELAPGATVLAVTRAEMVVVVRDADDVQRIRLYPL